MQNNGKPKSNVTIKQTASVDFFSLKFLEGNTIRAVAGIFGGLISRNGRLERGDGEVTDYQLFKELLLAAHRQGLGVLILA
jgi:hypothetical protein